MVRIKRGNVARKRRKKVLNRAKGFRGSLRRLFRAAKQAVYHSDRYSTIDRRKRKADFRRLWNARISAAVKNYGISYSKFIKALDLKTVKLNRKMLSQIAINDKEAFAKIVELVKGK